MRIVAPRGNSLQEEGRQGAESKDVDCLSGRPNSRTIPVSKDMDREESLIDGICCTFPPEHTMGEVERGWEAQTEAIAISLYLDMSFTGAGAKGGFR